jgi:hypothetical protein
MKPISILLILFVLAFTGPVLADTVDEEAVVLAALQNLSRGHEDPEPFSDPALLEQRQMDRDSAIFPFKATYFYGDLKNSPNLADLTAQLNEVPLRDGTWPDEIVQQANEKMDPNEIAQRVRLSQSISCQAFPDYRFFIYSKFRPEANRTDGLVMVHVKTLDTTRYPMLFICGF